MSKNIDCSKIDDGTYDILEEELSTSPTNEECDRALFAMQVGIEKYLKSKSKVFGKIIVNVEWK